MFTTDGAWRWGLFSGLGGHSLRQVPTRSTCRKGCNWSVGRGFRAGSTLLGTAVAAEALSDGFARGRGRAALRAGLMPGSVRMVLKPQCFPETVTGGFQAAPLYVSLRNAWVCSAAAAK